MTSLFRTRLALAATVSTLAFAAAPALAQGAAATVENEDGVVEEIIVTASKRAQTLQDTPISVAVTTVEAIERSQVRDLLDLQTLVPSLRVSQLQSSANTNFVIRGFGNGANNPGIEPSVGVFIDGVYRSRSAAQIGDLSNIERVEVLRGPQSTLFGKNASAGIISIVTQSPQFEFGGTGEISYGNYDAIVVRGAVTGPLSDKVAVAFDGNYNKRDGYARDLNLNTDVNDRNRFGVRGQLLFKPNDDVKIRLIADYDKIDEICCTVANLVDGPTGAAVRALGGRINSNQPFSYDSFNNFESINKIKNYGVSAQIDWNVADSLALTSISAYRGVRSNTNQDSDFTSADLIGENSNLTDINTYTQELRLASDYDGFFNFLLGGFYFKEDITLDAALKFGRDFRGYANALSGGAYSANEALLRTLSGLPASTAATAFGAQGQGRFEHYDFRNEAISIFGQGDFKLAETLTFTAGFNYTQDKKRAASNSRSTDVFSSIDLVQVGANAGIPGSIPLPTGTIFPRTTACPATGAVPGTCNPFLGLRPLQFLPPFLNFPNAVESGRTKDDDLSYTLRLSWEANDNLTAYATYATGFKASSFNLGPDSRPFPTDFIPGSPAQVPAPAASPIRTAGLAVANLTTGTRFAKPEEATVYEIGVKGQYDRFGFNLAIFQQNLKNFQGNVFQGTGFVLSNAEKQSTRGFELDTSFSPVPALNLTASVTYLDPKFDSYTGGSAFNATNTVVPTNLTGLRPTGISKWTTAIGATYTHEMNGGNELVLHADYLNASSFTVAQGLPYKASPESLNASIAFKMENGVELMIWGRNLTEPKFNPTIFPSVAQAGSLSAYPSPPATYGGSIRYRF